MVAQSPTRRATLLPRLGEIRLSGRDPSNQGVGRRRVNRSWFQHRFTGAHLVDKETREIIESAVQSAVDGLSIDHDSTQSLIFSLTEHLEAAGIAPDGLECVLTACLPNGTPIKVRVIATAHEANAAASGAVIECETLDKSTTMWLSVDCFHNTGKLCDILDRLAAERENSEKLSKSDQNS